MMHLSIKIFGKVQGVFFRASTKGKAEELRIKGFVRNEQDGSVYIEAEGNEKELREFAVWCEIGPPLSRVEHCDIKKSEVKGFNDFIIT